MPDDDPRIERHTFTKSLMMWGLRFLRASSCSFRAVSSILKQLFIGEKIRRAATPETLIQWELKIGLYKLERPKPKNKEYVWLADHVIRLGSYKCFVIVGVDVNHLRAKGDLTVRLEDLEPMAILPMQKSNGDEVAKRLQATMLKTGSYPKGLVIDHGSDLYSGAKKVYSRFPDMHIKYDVCHKVACELKKRLQTDAWTTMTSEATRTKKALSMTPFGQFSPPQQRSKARYMNLDTLVGWGCDILERYNELPERVKEQTAWLLPLKKNLALWNEWLEIGKIARDTIRIKGFYEGVAEVFMDRVIALHLSNDSNEFAEVLVDYIIEEAEGIPYKKRMLGSTESLEGLFSEYKRMAGENKMSVNGLGRLILCMSGRIGEFSENIVTAAMTHVRCKDVDRWLNEAFEQDRLLLEEIWEQSIEEAVCNF